MIARLFTAHPDAVGESYTEHFSVAVRFGLRMVLAGLACVVHAVLPFAFVTTASRTVRELHDRMANRHRGSPIAAGEVSPLHVIEGPAVTPDSQASGHSRSLS